MTAGIHKCAAVQMDDAISLIKPKERLYISANPEWLFCQILGMPIPHYFACICYIYRLLPYPTRLSTKSP